MDNSYRDDKVKAVWWVRQGEVISDNDIMGLVLFGESDQVR